jgi:hypothetical protein
LEPETESIARTGAPSAPNSSRAVRVGLSGKLLLLTVVFVMLAEILIYVPSIANFRLNWLNDRLAAAHTAALVLDAAPSGMVPESLAKQILDSIGARAVAMKMGDQRRLLAASNLPSEIEHDIDLRHIVCSTSQAMPSASSARHRWRRASSSKSFSTKRHCVAPC